MKSISKNTIAVLMTAAILISCIGIILGFTKIEKIRGVREISGFGAIGEINVSITQQVAINITFSNINFGSGYVASGKNYACLDSEKGTATGWSSTTIKNSSIIVENLGNTDLNVTFNMDKSTQDFIGGTNPRLEVKSADNETNSCDPVGSKGGLGALSSYTAITSASENRSVCNNLTSIDTSDSLTINVNLTIPSDAQGLKGVMFTFEASSPQ